MNAPTAVEIATAKRVILMAKLIAYRELQEQFERRGPGVFIEQYRADTEHSAYVASETIALLEMTEWSKS